MTAATAALPDLPTTSPARSYTAAPSRSWACWKVNLQVLGVASSFGTVQARLLAAVVHNYRREPAKLSH
jgi:hypothetical protein